MLSAALRDEFEQRGIVKIEGAFPTGDAARMRDVLWRELLRRYGIERDNPFTWDRHLPTGLKATKYHPAFGAILSPTVRDVLDDLFEGRWVPPKHFGNVLVTMPGPGPWRVPHKIWHSDFPTDLPPDRLVVVKIWALFGDIAPGGGGTPQLAGSHRLFARWLAGTTERDYKRCKFGFLKSHPWLRDLTRDNGDPQRNHHYMDTDTDLDGLPARVIECTGRAGDLYVTHPWVFHSIPTNASDHPRMLRSTAIARH
jgi:hypothetical protein